MRDLEKYNETFDKIYNSFSKETVGNNQIKLMPPLSNKPKIQRLSYDKKKMFLKLSLNLIMHQELKNLIM